MPRMPDIDVLEAAIAAANENEEEKKPESPAAGDEGSDGSDNTLGGVPALTLDAALEEKRKKGAAVSPQTAEELGKAESLKDLTDTMAETLFGNAEFEAVAAEVVANPPPGKGKPAKAKPDNPAPANSEPNKEALAAASEKDPSLMLELVEDTLAGEAQDPLASDKDIQLSTTRRFDLIKQLNSGENTENVEMGDTHGPKAAPTKKDDGPDSLEDQLQTAMTATLKAIDSGEAPPPDTDDDEPKKKTGLFGRFSR
jgi:hypothetical protein